MLMHTEHKSMSESTKIISDRRKKGRGGGYVWVKYIDLINT